MKYFVLLLLSFACSSIISVDKASTLAIDAGSRAFISLSSNPTTGYSWVMTPFKCTRFSAEEVGYVASQCGNVVGTGGVQVFEIEATKASHAGDTIDIEFQYKRSWETVAAQTRVITVSVNKAKQ